MCYFYFRKGKLESHSTEQAGICGECREKICKLLRECFLENSIFCFVLLDRIISGN
jgi:hypothetical protein